MKNHPRISRLLSQSLSFLLPQYCLFCREKTTNHFTICTNCIAALPKNISHCYRCSLPLEQSEYSGQRLCGNCLSHRYYYDQVYSPFLYSEGIRYLISQFKYHHKLHYSAVLTKLFTEASTRQDSFKLPQVFLPMPMHRIRMRQRGFNQALELARLLSRYFQIPMDCRSLLRIRNTDLQASLNRKERQKNVRQAFGLAKPLQYQHVALIDDVMTTGCTVNEAAHVLKTAGIRQVDIWCIARASLKF
jgi:ComF family protein